MLSQDPREYSNYYEGDIASGYPTLEGSGRPSAMPAIAKGLLTMAAFTVAAPVLNKVLGATGKMITTKLATGARTAGWYSKAAAATTKAASTVVTKYRTYLDADVSAYREWSQQKVGSGADASWYPKAKGHYASRIKSLMADRGSPEYRGRLLGGVESYFRSYARAMPGIYMTTKAIDMISGQKREAGPAWWNIPGRILDTAKDFVATSAAMLPMDAMFRGLTGGIKIMKDTLERSLRYRALTRTSSPSGTRYFKKFGVTVPKYDADAHAHRANRSQEFIHKVLSWTDNMRRRTVGTETSPGVYSKLRGASRSFYRNFAIKWGRVMPSPTETAAHWRDNVISGWRKGYVPDIKPLTNVQPGNFMKDIDKLQGLPVTGKPYMDALEAVFRSASKPKMGFLAKITGMRPMRYRLNDNQIDEVVSRLSLQNMDQATQDNIRKWMTTRYYERGVFHGGRGEVINLSRWRPSEVISRSVNYLHEKLAAKTPFSKIRPLVIFRAKRIKNYLLDTGKVVYEWGEGQRVRVGSLPPTVANIPADYAMHIATADKLAESYVVRGGYMKLGEGERMLAVKTGKRAYRMFYHRDGDANMLEFLPYNTRNASEYQFSKLYGRSHYYIMEEPLHGSTRAVQDIYYGGKTDMFGGMPYSEWKDYAKERYGWGKSRSWFYYKVLKTLEVGAGYGGSPGLLTRVRNLYMKYFSPDSPLVYMDDKKGFLDTLEKERAMDYGKMIRSKKFYAGDLGKTSDDMIDILSGKVKEPTLREQELMKYGRQRHEQIIKNLGAKLDASEISVAHRALNITGRADAVVNTSNGRVLYEFKTITPEKFRVLEQYKNDPDVLRRMFPEYVEHVSQTNFYLKNLTDAGKIDSMTGKIRYEEMGTRRRRTLDVHYSEDLYKSDTARLMDARSSLIARMGTKNPTSFITDDNIASLLHCTSGVRDILSDALDDSWHILKRRDVMDRYRNDVYNIGGSAYKLGDLMDDTPGARQRLLKVSKQLLSERPSPATANARHILDFVQDNEGYWEHAVTNTKLGRELTAADELQKMVFRSHIINQAAEHGDRMYLEDMLRDVNIGRRGILGGNKDRTLLRSVDTLAHFENRLKDTSLFIPEGLGASERAQLLEKYRYINPDTNRSTIDHVIDLLMDRKSDMAELSKVFYPVTSTRIPNTIMAPISTSTTTTSPWEVVIKSQFDDIFNVAGNAGLPLSQRVMGTMRSVVHNIVPKYSGGDGQPLTNPARFLMEATMRFEHLAESFGMGLDLSKRTTYQDIWRGVMSRMVLPGIGIYATWNALDTFTDTSPLFAGTSLDEGINVALAEQYVKQHLRMSSLADITGVTDAAKYMEGLMPGIVSSPASRLARGLGTPMIGAAIGTPLGPTGAGVGMMVGTALSALGGFGMYDLTKDRKQLEDEYAGRELVPVRANRFWFMSRSPLAGDRISYWRPSFFAKMKSQYKQTPTMYGSKLEEFVFRNPLMQPLALMIDPYHWERKTYFSAPYPQTGALFEDVPFIGPTMSSTVGKLIKPIKTMHRNELIASFNGPNYMGGGSGIGPNYFPPPGLNADIASPFVPAVSNEVSSSTGTLIRRPYPRSISDIRGTMSRQIYRGWEEPFGLWSWASMAPFRANNDYSEVVMENAGYRSSLTKAYWDLQLGDMMAGEFVRRFFPRQYNAVEYFNPLHIHASPDWLPGGVENTYFRDYRTGAALNKIKDAELRLPGWGNMAAYHVKLSMPFRASQIGKTYEEMVQYLTGTSPPASVESEEIMETGTMMHRMVQDELRRNNVLVKAEAPIFEPYSDVSGHVDAIVRKGRSNTVMEIKTVSTDKLEQLASPMRQHLSQINFYMKSLGLNSGDILYISRDDPSLMKSFPVRYSSALYNADIMRLRQARGTARELLRSGYGHPGSSYSHIDRLRVLGDLAPTSDEYKEELRIVNTLGKMGMLTPDEIAEKDKIVRYRKAAQRNFDMYPRRFDLSGIFYPDSKYQQLSSNENIKAASEYSFPARVIGGLYEYMTHQRTPFHNKLLGTFTPRELYEKNVLYGSKAGFWEHPYRDFIEPYMRASLSTRKIDEGVIRGLQAGYLMGGPPGAAIGAGAYGVYGAVHGAFRWLTGSTYIPGNVEGKWEISEYYDRMKFLKAQRLYQMTGAEEYSKQASETMAGMNMADPTRTAYQNISRAVPYYVRPYIFAFMNETDKDERERIRDEVPPDVARLLDVRWAMSDKDRKRAVSLARSNKDATDLTSYFNKHHLPGEDSAMWHPSVKLEDVMVKVIDKKGWAAQEFGMGFADQMIRMRQNPFTPGPIDINDPTGNPVYPERELDRNEIQRVIGEVMRQYGATSANISISTTPGMGSSVVLNASVDSSNSIINYRSY